MKKSDEKDGEAEEKLLGDNRPNQLEDDFGDVVMVLENDRLKIAHKDHNDLQSPLRSITDVLKMAENIMTDGPLQAATTRGQVIVDQVDVEFCPKTMSGNVPIEIIVRHNKVTEQPASDSDDEGPSYRPSRLSTVHEGEESRDDLPGPSTGTTIKKNGSWKKGHRRAWSMPNAKGEKMSLAVIQDNHEQDGNRHRRRIVKYRLQPNKRGDAGGEMTSAPSSVPTASRVCDLRFEMSDEEDELEVEINEEEVIIPGESGKGARTVVKRFWEARWKATNFETLPDWLQDNEYLRTGHRPPIPSFSNCFKSIFALHTETGNIWTHMYGCVAFIGVGLWCMTRPSDQVQWIEKLIYSMFFIGAVVCLGMSFVFHTVACHSVEVGKLFSKLDYTADGHLQFHDHLLGHRCDGRLPVGQVCRAEIQTGTSWRFFVAMGLSAVVPAAHLLITDGLTYMFQKASLHWMLIMGAMYIGGATIYATRIPERCFPGKCDLWFQSHQLFHTFVVIAAFIHYHAIIEMGMIKMMDGSCPEQLLEQYGSEKSSVLARWTPWNR
ncbi:unnamed protein product [Caenorhabditis auriculariae]|uniref:Uncharacterized protein n=1 Tax=Caenorhabditis auriculariae TaxID=2777116 RepID=A0A8S1HIJ7_9PELO|nr:unnamed protein product [Caenorhabditis auriculariae]